MTAASAWPTPAYPGEVTPRPGGDVLYARYCAGCHGGRGAGDGPDATALADRPPDLRRLDLARYSTEAVLARIRSGAALSLGLDDAELRRQAVEVDELVTYLERLPSLDWVAIEPGWNLYAERCQSCHGQRGERRSATVPSLASPELQRRLSDEQMVTSVRSGHHGMPGLIPRLSAVEAQRVVSFVRMMTPGFTLYSRYCANCHSDDGRGVHALGSVLGEELALPSTEFDREYFRSRSPSALRDAVWHMLTAHKPTMPHFRLVLPEPELRAIVDHLRKAMTPPDPEKPHP